MGDQHALAPQQAPPEPASDQESSPRAKKPSRVLYPRHAMSIAGAGAPDGPPLARDTLLFLQRTIGNRAVGQLVQRQAADGSKQSSVPPSVGEALQTGGGATLPQPTRERMEGLLGADLGGVRTHTGSQAAAAARDVNARAFTTGSDIYFGAGQYQPHTADGQRLLAHELTHTVQQAAGRSASQDGPISHPDDPLEREAEAVAQHFDAAARDRAPVTPPDKAPAPRAARATGGPAALIQRDLFGPSTEGMTNRQIIDRALETKDNDWVQRISNFGEATVGERVRLLDILHNQFWVGPIDELAMEMIWNSFGASILDVARDNETLWFACVEDGAELDDLPAIERVKETFKQDTAAAALHFLSLNEQYIHAEMEALGIGVTGPPNPEQAQAQQERLAEMREVAADVIHARQALDELRRMPVGWTMGSGEGMPSYETATFDPERRPEFDHNGVGYAFAPSSESAEIETRHVPEEVRHSQPMLSWESVKAQYDRVTAVIAGFANQYPIIYGMLADESQADERLAQLAAEGPQSALRAVETTMNGVLEKIGEARAKITGGQIDTRDLKPIHRQLFDGLRPPGWSGHDWQQRIYKWAADDLLEDYEFREFWIQLGLGTLAAAAFVVAELATLGSATFIIAAGVGIGLSVGGAARSWDHYMNLATAADATVRDELALVSRGQVDAARMDAIINSVFAFIDVAGPALRGARALRGLGRAGEQAGEQVSQEAIENAAREASEQALRRGTGEAAEGAAAAAARRVAPEEAANWAQVSHLIGQDVTQATLPQGYSTFQRGGKTFIRRATGDDALFARLTVDEAGRIQAGRAASRRISRPGALAAQLGARPANHQAHHVVPDEIVRDHPLFQAARSRGNPPFAVDARANGAYLAETAGDRVAGVSDAMPLHSGSHPRYNNLARTEADAVLNQLIAAHGGLENVPPQVLSRAASDVQDRMRQHLSTWIQTQGDILR